MKEKNCAKIWLGVAFVERIIDYYIEFDEWGARLGAD